MCSGIQGIILPPKLKKRRRPKGAEKTYCTTNKEKES